VFTSETDMNAVQCVIIHVSTVWTDNHQLFQDSKLTALATMQSAIKDLLKRYLSYTAQS